MAVIIVQAGAAERFLRHVEIPDDPDACWIWTGCLSGGYGRFNLGARGAGTALTHRFAYELLVGPIPDGHELDHLCHSQALVGDVLENPRAGTITVGVAPDLAGAIVDRLLEGA